MFLYFQPCTAQLVCSEVPHQHLSKANIQNICRPENAVAIVLFSHISAQFYEVIIGRF